MSKSPRSADEIARQWQSLAERRRQHLLELYRSGRWKRYYTEDKLMTQMREAVRDVEGWGTISGEPPAPAAGVKPLGEAAE